VIYREARRSLTENLLRDTGTLQTNDGGADGKPANQGNTPMTNLDNRIDPAVVRIPNVQLGNSLAHRMVAGIARSALGIRIIRNVGPHIDSTLIRLTGGRLSSVIPFPALLLSHAGARSGVTRATPLVYFTEAGRVIVIASNFGALRNPAWYHNIKANPEVTLLGRGFRGSFLAEEVAGPERDRLFRFAEGASSPYGHYQQSAAARLIAVVAFRPIG